nr:hypothetical protein [Tanacetum cinerariifolium]
PQRTRGRCFWAAAARRYGAAKGHSPWSRDRYGRALPAGWGAGARGRAGVQPGGLRHPRAPRAHQRHRAERGAGSRPKVVERGRCDGLRYP